MDLVLSNNNQLFANSKFTAKALVLVPCGPVQLVASDKISKTSITLTLAGMGPEKVFVVQSSRCDFSKPTGMFCPFFWMKEAAEDEEFNMVRSTLKHKDLTIPCYRNSKAVARGSRLLLEAQPEPKKKARK